MKRTRGAGYWLWEILRSVISFVLQRNGKICDLIHKPGSYIALVQDTCQIWTWSTNAMDTFAKFPAEKWWPGNRLNIKIFYQYKDPHVKDKTKSRPSHDRFIFDTGIAIPVKDRLYIETGPRASSCRRYSNYIFILDLTPGFIGLGKDNCKTRRESFKFGYLMRLILEILR